MEANDGKGDFNKTINFSFLNGRYWGVSDSNIYNSDFIKALKEEEVPLIKEYALSWIDYILQGNQFDTSTIESLEVRYDLIKENL